MSASAFRALVRRWGTDSTVEQACNGAMQHWLGNDAGVGYAVGRAPGARVWFAAGGPVCDPSRRASVARRFETAARAASAVPAWFAVDAQTVRAIGPGHAALVIGAEPVWDPARWDETVAGRASLRSQVRRALRRGAQMREEDARLAAADPGVRAVLAFWLSTRGLPPLAFLADPFVLDAPGDRRAFVARLDGRVVGVLWLAPVPARDGWLVEWNWRGQNAPNGVTDGLLDLAVRTVASEGARMVSLGLVPLSSFAPKSEAPPSLAVRLAFVHARAHARRFYHFAGLKRFKAKYQPDRWEPLHLVVPGERVGLRTLYAVADVFSGSRGPVRLVGEALAGAVRDEARTLAAAMRARVSRRRIGRSPGSSG